MNKIIIGILLLSTSSLFSAPASKEESDAMGKKIVGYFPDGGGYMVHIEIMKYRKYLGISKHM